MDSEDSNSTNPFQDLVDEQAEYVRNSRRRRAEQDEDPFTLVRRNDAEEDSDYEENPRYIRRSRIQMDAPQVVDFFDDDPQEDIRNPDIVEYEPNINLKKIKTTTDYEQQVNAEVNIAEELYAEVGRGYNNDPNLWTIQKVEPIRQAINRLRGPAQNNAFVFSGETQQSRNIMANGLETLLRDDNRPTTVLAIASLLDLLLGLDNTTWQYQLFKFFIGINNEINPQYDKFYRNFSTWKLNFHRYVLNNPNGLFNNDERASFDGKYDLLAFKMSPSHVEACIELVVAYTVQDVFKDSISYFLRAGEFNQIGYLRKIPALTEEPKPIPNETLSKEFHIAMYNLSVMFCICRKLWSYNIKLADLMRSNEEHYTKRNNNGQQWIEAYPYLMSTEADIDGPVMSSGDMGLICNGIRSYYLTYLLNYDIVFIDCKVFVKRVVFADGAEKDISDLEENYWILFLNPFRLLPMNQAERDVADRDFLIMKHRNNSGARNPLGIVVTADRAAAFARIIGYWNQLAILLPTMDSGLFVDWFVEQIDEQLQLNYEKYQEVIILQDGDQRARRWHGLSVFKFIVSAFFNIAGRAPSHANPMERPVSVHCREGLKHGWVTLSVMPEVVPSIGSLCLWQAHFTALNLSRMKDKKDNMRKRDVRVHFMVERFKDLPQAHKEIFMNGNIQLYRQHIQPDNIVSIIYERDDPEEVMNQNNNHLKTPIAVWEGHAVCSSWDKIITLFRKSMALDSKIIENRDVDSRDRTRVWYQNTRDGKVIKAIKPLADEEAEGSDLNHYDYFMDIETYDEPYIITKDGQVVTQYRMKPYLIVMVSEHLKDGREVFWGYDCVEQWLNWFSTIHSKERGVPLPVPKDENGDPYYDGDKTFGINSHINIWGYNSYNFDYIPIARRLAYWHEFKLKGSLTSIKVMELGSTRFYDLMKILPWGKLSDQARVWKTAHQKLDFDHEIVNKEWLDNISNEDKARCIDYCVNDCIVLQEVFEKYYQYVIDNYDINPYVFSAASLGFNVWRRNLFSTSFKIQGIKEMYYNAIQDSYKGGMVFLTQKQLLPGQIAYMYDIHSSYPTRMLSPMPCTFNNVIVWNQSQSLVDMDPNILNDATLYHVEGFKWSNDHWLPLIPKRTSEGLRYELHLNPVEHIWGVELKEALYSGLVVDGRIIKEYRFNTAKIFEKFIQKMYQERLECKAKGDILGSEFRKLMMNSTYGKAAQKIYARSETVTQEKFLYFLGTNDSNIAIENTMDLGDGLFRIEFTDIEYYRQVGSNIPIASYITASARAAVCYAARIVSDNYKKRNVLYGDTDSMVVLDKLPESMVHKDALGMWELEHTFDEWIGIAPKVYCAHRKEGTYLPKNVEYDEWKMRFKGVPRRYTKPEIFKKLLKDKKIKIDSGFIWKRLKEGVVSKIPSNKLVKPVDRRLFISDYYSIPYSNNGEL